MPLFLRSLADQNLNHGCFISVDHRRCPQNDIARALSELWKLRSRLDWTNRSFFLHRQR